MVGVIEAGQGGVDGKQSVGILFPPGEVPFRRWDEKRIPAKLLLVGGEMVDQRTVVAAEPVSPIVPHPALLGEFEGLARELNMPQDETQAIVERMTPKIQARMQAQQIEIMAQARADWLQQIESDAEIGGAAKQASQASAAKALHQFGTPELRVLLKDSGLEAHPEVVRFFSRAGKAISEDSFVSGRPPTKSTAQALYGASNMNP